jgi:hypothetical protein
MVAVFAAACSTEPAEKPEVEQPPGDPAPAPEATTGREPSVPKDAEPKPAVRATTARRVETAATRDERAAATGPVTQAANRAGVNASAAVLQDFKGRIDNYVAIHKEAAKGDAKPKETENPAEITATQDALAARIRAARPAAKQGDIFTAEIRTAFRRLLAPELKGEDGRDAKAVMKEDAPAPSSIPFKVHAKYPEGAPLPSVPSNLLLNLPTLPEPLEYRIIGKHLVLLDTGAGIIVDYIPNAIA